MIKNVWILPNGEEITSGQPDAAAIRSVRLTRQVNAGQELTPGGVCASLLEATVFVPGTLALRAGEEFSAWKEAEDGTRTCVGIFIAQKPVRQSAHVCAVTAYDRVSLLDRDLTQWLAGLRDWPYTLRELAQMTCAQCGVELVLPEEDEADAFLPNSGFPVQPFTAEGITGRQLMQWIGQALGRFCRARPDGCLEFAWYTPNTAVTLGPGDYYQGGLACADYTVAPVENVQIRQNEQDVGTVFPDAAGGGNTFFLTGNCLLSAGDAGTLMPIARSLYEQLRQAVYTPCTLRMPLRLDIAPGDILPMTDATGRRMEIWVMKTVQQGQQMTVECTGSPRRDGTAAVQNRSWQALSGKVMNLRVDVDGLKAENRDASGRMAKLELDLGGLRTSVASQDGKLSALEQTAQGLQLSVGSIGQAVEEIASGGAPKVKTPAKGYTFDDRGLTIHDPADEITNLLDQTGMYVKRSGEVMLQANNKGVVATDVTVRNYLRIGHARFEKYTDGQDNLRTACFYLEEVDHGS